MRATPAALSKSELQTLVWPETFVIEANLQHLIAEIRRVLHDDPRRPRYVRTVHGFGYAFQEPLVSGEPRPSPAPVCRLRWDGGRITLGEGNHVIGRDRTADVVLDSSTVSRHHARIQVAGDEVLLVDLGSKNGSYVRGHRVDGTLRLADGDEIRIGMVPVSVRIVEGVASTETAVLNPDVS